VAGALLLLSAQLTQAQSISAPAERLSQIIDSLDVEHHWPAGVHVHWETGVPDGRPESSSGKHTHCSAFVAAAGKHLGIYILRPPEHEQILLANAQYDWLHSDGAAHGWMALPSAIDAQRYANRGWFVVAAYKNPNDSKPGHIAIVRPSAKDERTVSEEGPQITQAGAVNYRSAALRVGFAGHLSALTRQRVLFYAHEVDAAALK
jgi:hypothetical protein